MVQGNRLFRRSRCFSFAVLAVLLLAASLVSSQTLPDGVVTINGGKDTLYLKAPKAIKSTTGLDTSSMVTIFSNLGKGDHVYSGVAGTSVVGRGAGFIRPQWSAFAFTPTADATALAVKVGAGHVSGANDLVVSINEDDRGRPGKTLSGLYFTDLPVFGSCCVLQARRLKTSVPLKKDTQYWLVLKTPHLTDDTFDVWNNDIHGENGPYSNNLGQGWQDGGIQQQGAFAVFGSN